MLCNWVEELLLSLVGPKLDKSGSGKNREAGNDLVLTFLG